MTTFKITKDFDLSDLAGIPSDGSENTVHKAGDIQGISEVDENGYPIFSYPVGAFAGNSGWFWSRQDVGVPVPEYGSVSNDSGADGSTGLTKTSTKVLGMPPTVGKTVVVVALLAGVYFGLKHFKVI